MKRVLLMATLSLGCVVILTGTVSAVTLQEILRQSQKQKVGQATVYSYTNDPRATGIASVSYNTGSSQGQGTVQLFGGNGGAAAPAAVNRNNR